MLSLSPQPHRVLLPVEEAGKTSVRQSLAFFCHPDNQVLVECVDGSNKYPPVLAVDDAMRRLRNADTQTSEFYSRHDCIISSHPE